MCMVIIAEHSLIILKMGKQRLIEEVCCADEQNREAMLNDYLLKMFFDDVEILDDVRDCFKLVEGDWN